MEKNLIKILLNKEAHGRFRGAVKEEAVSKEGYRLILCIDEMQDTSLIPTLDTDDVYEYLSIVKYPGLKQEVKDMYRSVLDGINRMDDTVSEAVITALVEREYFTKIRDVAESISSGTGDHSPEEVETLLEKFHRELSHVNVLESSHVGVDIPELFSAIAVSGYEWRLPQLQDSTGPIPNGAMVLAGARPETGKSTFLASEISHMAYSLPPDKCILVIANEEPGPSVQARYVQASLGMSRLDITADPVSAQSKFHGMHSGRSVTDVYKFYHNPSFRMRDIRKLAEKHNPAIIVIDQLRHVGGHEKRAATEVERLKALYQEARAMAAEFGPLFTVHQAGGAAEGIDFIPGNMLEGCQTEVQGALDVQIMIGRKPEEGDSRYLNVVKNKLMGCRDESARHGKFTCKISGVTSRFY